MSLRKSCSVSVEISASASHSRLPEVSTAWGSSVPTISICSSSTAE
jgi:hypothetical protein